MKKIKKSKVINKVNINKDKILDLRKVSFSKDSSKEDTIERYLQQPVMQHSVRDYVFLESLKRKDLEQQLLEEFHQSTVDLAIDKDKLASLFDFICNEFTLRQQEVTFLYIMGNGICSISKLLNIHQTRATHLWGICKRKLIDRLRKPSE